MLENSLEELANGLEDLANGLGSNVLGVDISNACTSLELSINPLLFITILVGIPIFSLLSIVVQCAFGQIHLQYFCIPINIGNCGFVVLCQFELLEMQISNVLTLLPWRWKFPRHLWWLKFSLPLNFWNFGGPKGGGITSVTLLVRF